MAFIKDTNGPSDFPGRSVYKVYILCIDTFHGQPKSSFLADEVEPELLKRPTELSVIGGLPPTQDQGRSCASQASIDSAYGIVSNIVDIFYLFYCLIRCRIILN